MRQGDLWRRAAGVADYIGQGAPGRHFGRWLCLNCPRDWHEPPFLPFRLPIHIREHRERFPDHTIAWWCWDHLAIEAAHNTGWRWVYEPLYIQPPPVLPRVGIEKDGRRQGPLGAGRLPAGMRKDRGDE